MRRISTDNDDYSQFLEDHKEEVLRSAVAAIEPDRMGMTRDQALTLAGAMKTCGFSQDDFAEVMQRSAQDKGTFAKQWDKMRGKGKHGEAGEGTIFSYAQQCGWKWPAPDQDARQANRPTPTGSEAKKPELALLGKWHDDFKFTCIIDTQEYTRKPEKAEIGTIRGREKINAGAPEPISPTDFAIAVTSGRTFSPTVYNKELQGYDKNRKPKYEYRAIEQQIFSADIDNEEHYTDANGKPAKRRVKRPLDIPDALAICEQNGLKPFFVYETFSSKEHRDAAEDPYKKFRLCFVTDKPITVQEYGEAGINDVNNFLMSMFGDAVDAVTIDSARLMFGTDEKDRAHLYGAVIDSKKLMTKLRQNIPQPEVMAQQTEETKEDTKEDAKADYLQTSAAAHMQEFEDIVSGSANTPAISTGFHNLDFVLDGGLYEGLYFIGAISSLGKTTLALQIIDQIAQQEQDCLVFSLEMARSELMAKSISRLTYLGTERSADAKTTRGITAGARYARYSDTEKALIEDAKSRYTDYAQHIFIHEGVGNIGVEEIKDAVQKHITITGNRPVVLIDYLQILAPYDLRASDKQNTDKAVLELKRLTRDYKIPLIGISSFNRENYTAPVNNASFKESGAIEYSADVLIGLQYEGMDYQDGENDKERLKRVWGLIRSMETKAKNGEAQTIQAKILKNRNGSKGEAIFNFYAMFNCFKEHMPWDSKRGTEAPAGMFEGMKAK